MAYSGHNSELSIDNCSTAAEMGDRARAEWAKKWGTAVPLSVGELRRSLTQRRLGRGLPPYQVAS